MSDTASFPPDPFLVAIDKFIARSEANLDLTIQAIAQDTLARVKELTPVKTGYLRANWQLVVGGQVQSIEGARAGDSAAAALQLKAGGYFTILNAVVYARRIEYGFVGEDTLGRHYDQKGRFMMTQTIAELPKIAAAAVARVNRGA